MMQSLRFTGAELQHSTKNAGLVIGGFRRRCSTLPSYCNLLVYTALAGLTTSDSSTQRLCILVHCILAMLSLQLAFTRSKRVGQSR